MRALVVLALVAASSFAIRVPRPSAEPHWNAFKSTHLKSYRDGQEELIRRFIFEDNLHTIEEFNRVNASLAGFTLGVNEFADMTNTEFSNMLLGLGGRNKIAGDSVFESSHVQDLPAEVDWTQKGYVTEVKNQGQCGSCWAFSTTGSLEGQVFKKTGKLVSLSEQNLVDCSTSEGNQGCNGGLMDQAFTYIKKNGGIDTEAAYPYTGSDGTCRFLENKVGATVSGFVDVKSGDENALKEAVATVGPISVAIDASSIFFQFYRGGVYNPWFCSSTELDHGVLVVGYGTEGGKDYWLVKNSWGSSWGLKGYIKMVRNKKNRCGIATQASYPTV
ncbi:cathepsin L1 [Galendromus occidentalis]|uniref:Cathepsin L1 n=1 Tax=Galendromus occidentalis TaxID=34638 RepID=A0AAJ6QQE0_9ACAR|nr:cathepsin L1 [Galendromus occidentalis]